MHATIKSIEDLRQLSASDLEKEANIVLYGRPLVLEEALERQVIQRLYVPRNLNRPLVYREPKPPGTMNRNSPILKLHVCNDCGKPKHYSSGQFCQFCFSLRVRMRFYEKQQGAIWLESQFGGGGFGEFVEGQQSQQRIGITMPVTEWWDDTDEGKLRYLANLKW